MATISNDKNWRFPDYTDSPDIPRDISYLAADISEYIDNHPGPTGATGATGATGPSNVLSVGTVTTGNAGSSASVTIAGTSPSQTISFTIPRGDTGATGLTGEQGIQGVQGIQGEQGIQGLKGDKGDTGETGATGATGPTGPQGEQGIQGIQGIQGEQGTGVNILGSYANLTALQAAHPTGSPADAYLINNDLYVWSQSTSSWINVGTIRGPQGDQGIQGIQGLKGDKGDTGDTGATGATGPQGPQGEQGIQGIQGIQGETGLTGATGETGAAGQDLVSVFTIAQKSSSYTIVSSDLGKLIEMSSGGTITVPTDSEIFAVGSTVDIVQTGSSQVTIAGDTGVTVNATPGLKLRSQWSSVTLIKRGNNLWVALGDLSA
jgi:hypothetical protein